MNLSRRHTLGVAGAATGWSLIPGKVLGANNEVRLAAIGIGQQGGSILRSISGQPGVKVVALCDVDANQLGAAKRLLLRARRFDPGPKSIQALNVERGWANLISPWNETATASSAESPTEAETRASSTATNWSPPSWTSVPSSKATRWSSRITTPRV